MDRRLLIGIAVACAAAWPGGALAQTAARIHRVGFLRPGRAYPGRDPTSGAVAKVLADAGYVEGRNLNFEERYADGQPDRLPALARELVQAKVDVIVAVGANAVRAAAGATRTIPIVMWGNFDPVALGLVDSLARPGGNVTGVLIAPDGTLAAKRLELLKAAVPHASRIALLVPDDPAIATQVDETRKAAGSLAVDLTVTAVRDFNYPAAFAAIVAARPDALLVASHQYFVRDRREIIDLAARHRLPAMYEWREHVVDGGLMTYSTSMAALQRRVAFYVEQALKGTSPGALPVERPTRFELVINMRTAKTLGLAVPPDLLRRADELIK